MILSVGCGDKNCEFGVDIRKTPYTTVQASGEYLPFSYSVFDRVEAVACLEHCTNPANVMQEAKRVLKFKGSFYASVPIDSVMVLYQIKQLLLLRMKDVVRTNRDIRRGDHKWQFSIRGSEKLLNFVGFRNVRVYKKMIFPYIDGNIILEVCK